MGRLEELAAKYGCDKLFSHSYIPIYEELFAHFEPNLVLEIGIGYEDLMKPFVPIYVHGASLRMWSEFWPNAELIAGVDIRVDAIFNEGKIHCYEVDQSRPKDLWMITEPWDLVIDDGSHVKEHQLLTAAVLIPKMEKGSIYVIEDVYRDSGAELAEKLGGRLVTGERRPDDNLVIIEL